jgi:DNA helicase IV
LDFGTSEYNSTYTKASTYQDKLDNYKAIKKEYDDAIKTLRDKRAVYDKSYGMDRAEIELANNKEYQTAKSIVDQISNRLVIAERQLNQAFDSKNKYEHDLNALSNSIRVQGLPKSKQALTAYTKSVINSLGLMDVLYNRDGELNEDFVGVGYASDKEIDQAAKDAADYFKSTDFKSGMNA